MCSNHHAKRKPLVAAVCISLLTISGPVFAQSSGGGVGAGGGAAGGGSKGGGAAGGSARGGGAPVGTGTSASKPGAVAPGTASTSTPNAAGKTSPSGTGNMAVPATGNQTTTPGTATNPNGANSSGANGTNSPGTIDPASPNADPNSSSNPANNPTVNNSGAAANTQQQPLKSGGGRKGKADAISGVREGIDTCMALWEEALHMTKNEWRAACVRTRNGIESPSASGSTADLTAGSAKVKRR